MEQELNEMPEEQGRGGDTVMAHLSLGELVIPRAFLDDPRVMEAMKQLFDEAGVNINQYIVGDAANSINPETGYPEFGFFKKAFKFLAKAAPIAAAFIPGLQPLAAAGIGAASSLATGGGLKGSLLSALGGYAGAGGFGNTAIGRGIDSLKSGISDTVLGRGVSDIYRSASGALSDIGNEAQSLYNGSALQSGFNSGTDALKSIVGIDTTSTAAAPSVGGGASSYGPQLENAANIPGYASNSIGPQTLNAANALTTGATEVAKSKDYASPILSALLGSYSNNQAEDAQLKGQKANQALLAPYANGFSFTPQDLQNDPGYQFNLSEGTKAADRAQLARGGYFSGGAAKELAGFTQGLADNTYNSAFNRALQGNQAGLTGALANAGVNTNIGDIKANSATNQGNLYSGALGSLLGGQTFTNTGALQGGIDIQAILREMQRKGASSYAGA